MTYPNVIVAVENLHLKITRDLEILQNFLKDRDVIQTISKNEEKIIIIRLNIFQQ